MPLEIPGRYMDFERMGNTWKVYGLRKDGNTWEVYGLRKDGNTWKVYGLRKDRNFLNSKAPILQKSNK